MSTCPMKKILYLGTAPSQKNDDILHYPVIELIPKQIEEVQDCLKKLSMFSLVLFTSKNTVRILWDLCHQLGLDATNSLQNRCVSIGDVTSSALRDKGVEPLFQAKEATQEGMIASLSLNQSDYVLYPRSSLARPLLSQYLREASIAHETLDLYTTIYQSPLPIPNLSEVKEIVFTSPSTVEGFFKIFSSIPQGITLSFQGSITRSFFLKKIESELINL